MIRYYSVAEIKGDLIMSLNESKSELGTVVTKWFNN